MAEARQSQLLIKVEERMRPLFDIGKVHSDLKHKTHDYEH